MAQLPEQDPRVYFAAERTFLAWIRTGLGLKGVGFAVVPRQNSITQCFLNFLALAESEIRTAL